MVSTLRLPGETPTHPIPLQEMNRSRNPSWIDLVDQAQAPYNDSVKSWNGEEEATEGVGRTISSVGYL